MMEYQHSADYNDALLAELYDQNETYVDDVLLIRRLIHDRPNLKILECFSGTGRIAIPLAIDGHRVTCLEKSSAMTERARAKTKSLDLRTGGSLKFIEQDILSGNWGSGYDLVILGANCLYELATAEAQKDCINHAFNSLKTGGAVFIDNQNYQGGWENLPFGKERITFEGFGADGTCGRFSCMDLSFDPATRQLSMKRIKTTKTNGQDVREEYFAKKRPVIGDEVRNWLEECGLLIVESYGDRDGAPLTQQSDRAIFLAIKP